MKKTFTRKEFEKLTHSIVEKAMKNAEKNLSGSSLMAITMCYLLAFSELETELFTDNTDIIEIKTEKES